MLLLQRHTRHRKPDQVVAGSVNLLFMPDQRFGVSGNIPPDVTYYHLASYDGPSAMRYVLQWACERYPFFMRWETIGKDVVIVKDQVGDPHYLRREDGYKKIATVAGLGSFIVLDLR